MNEAKLIATPTTASDRLRSTLGALTLARLVVNGSRRFPYIILTPMAAALGVPRATLESALSLQWAVGVLSPLFGTLIERLGRKRVMLIGMGLLGGSALVAALGDSFGFVLVAIVAGGLAKVLFDPAMQAYIGDRVPYARRGMAIGITELSWSGSLVIFGPLAAYLISQSNLSAIFAFIAIGAGLSFILLAVILPGDTPPKHDSASDAPRRITPGLAFKLITDSRPAMAMLLSSAFVSMASELINIAYESWLRDVFALTTVSLGLLSWAISAAEVVGEGFVIVWADRLGKRRLAIFTLAVTGIIYLLVPFTTFSLVIAVSGLFLMFVAFETGVVVLIPLTTEVLPSARALLLSVNAAAFSLGRAAGAKIGGDLFRLGGFGLNGLLAAALSLSAAVLIWRGVRGTSLD